MIEFKWSSLQLTKSGILAEIAENLINRMDSGEQMFFEHIYVSYNDEYLHFHAYRNEYNVHKKYYYDISDLENLTIEKIYQSIRNVYQALIDAMFVKEIGSTTIETNNPILLPESIFKEIMNERKIGENI